MKTLAALLLALLVCVAVAACGVTERVGVPEHRTVTTTVTRTTDVAGECAHGINGTKNVEVERSDNYAEKLELVFCRGGKVLTIRGAQ